MKFWNSLPKAEDGYSHAPARCSSPSDTGVSPVCEALWALPAVGLCASPEEEGLCALGSGVSRASWGNLHTLHRNNGDCPASKMTWLWAALLWLRRVMRLPFRGGFSQGHWGPPGALWHRIWWFHFFQSKKRGFSNRLNSWQGQQQTMKGQWKQPFLNLSTLPRARLLWIRRTFSFGKVGQQAHKRSHAFSLHTPAALPSHKVHMQTRMIKTAWHALNHGDRCWELTILQNWETNL